MTLIYIPGPLKSIVYRPGYSFLADFIYHIALGLSYTGGTPPNYAACCRKQTAVTVS